MTTNGTGITREEAETIFNMVKLSKEHNDGTIAVLKKLQTAYPDLLHGTDFPRLIREYDARIRVNKQEAKKIASASKVSFELYVGDPDISQYYDADYGGWNSSNC